MTSVISVTREGDTREALLSEFKSKSCVGAASTAAAVFLIIPALIVIFSGALVLTLPGINAMTQVILPAFLPAAGAILLSLPFILISCKKREEINRIREKQVEQIQGILGRRNFKNFSIEKNVEWVEKNIVEPKQNPYYNQEWINAIKEKLSDANKKDKNDPLTKALDKASENLFKKKEAKKEKKKKEA